MATVLCDDEWDDDDVVFLDSSAVRVARDLENEQLLREQALRDAEAEGLTLKTSASNPTGFVCVKQWQETHQRRGEMVRGAGHGFFSYRVFERANTSRCPQRELQGIGVGTWNNVEERREYLGSYVTAEEAALAYARSCALHPPTKGPGKPGTPSMTAEEAIRVAEAEGLPLVRAPGTKSGYKGVSYQNDKKHAKAPYSVNISVGGRLVRLGAYFTAEEAALSYARYIGPEEAAKAAEVAEHGAGSSLFHPDHTAVVVTKEEVAQQAEAEGLTLERDATKESGFKGVTFCRGISKPSRASSRSANLGICAPRVDAVGG